MAELLVKAVSATHWNLDKETRGCWKRGDPVVVMPDGHIWGSLEGLPRFVLIKVPGIGVERVEKYVSPRLEADGTTPISRRLWRIRWDDLPTQAKNKLRDTGQLIIKAGAYSGPFDYTWLQIRSYFRNLTTGLDETGDI